MGNYSPGNYYQAINLKEDTLENQLLQMCSSSDMLSPDILDVEVLCYICKDHVMLGSYYMCHLSYAHDIMETDLDDEQENDWVQKEKSATFQCEICGEAFKGRKTIEAHIRNLHAQIVKELEEEIGDFYSLLRAVAKQETS